METTGSNSSKDMVGLAVVITIGIILLLVKYRYGSIDNFMNAMDNFSDSIHMLFVKLTTLAVLLSIIIRVIVLIIFLILIYNFFKFVLGLISRLIKRTIFLRDQKMKIENLLLLEIPFNEEEILSEIEILNTKLSLIRQYRQLNRFNEKIKKRLEDCLDVIKELKKENRLQERRQEVEWMERKAEELDEKISIRETYSEPDMDIILYRLKAEEKNVFKKDKLNKNQVKALEKNGFKQRTEFSVFEKKYIRVLVKSALNHSDAHTFLVWDTLRLLKEFKEIKKIKEHLTVGADITFNFMGKIYALEIETGTLLGKKQQTEEKINYLNKKYAKRWLIIVSNKNILSKYQKLGFSTTRNMALENVKKLLKIG